MNEHYRTTQRRVIDVFAIVSANTPVTTQMPCFATVSAIALPLRGPTAPTRSCCPARGGTLSSDSARVAALAVLRTPRAVTNVNMGNGAVNVMKAAVLRGLRCWCGLGGLVRRQTHHVALAKVFPLLQGLYIHSPPHLSTSPLYYHLLSWTPYFPTFLLLKCPPPLYTITSSAGHPTFLPSYFSESPPGSPATPQPQLETPNSWRLKPPP